MGRKKTIPILLVLLSMLGAGYLVFHYWLGGYEIEIQITEEQLIEKLNEKFPFQKTYFFFIGLRFENPVLALEEGSDRIHFGCDVETKIKIDSNRDLTSGPLRGTAEVSGQLRYEPSDGTFFLDQPEIKKLSIKGLPQKLTKKVNTAASKSAEEFLQRAPVYRLKATDVKQAAARLILKKVIVREKKLNITLGLG